MLMPVDARSVPRPPAAALLWVTWVAATALGGLIGEFVIWWLRSVLFPVAPPSLALPLYCLLIVGVLVAAGLLLWFPVSLAQGLVLRWLIPGFDQPALHQWIKTSVLSASGALVLIAPLFLLLITTGYWLSYQSIQLAYP